MSHQRYPTDLTDSQWHLIKEWLPPPARTGRPRLDLREVLNAVFYVTKGGIQWRLLPKDFPKWQSVLRDTLRPFPLAISRLLS